jgi:polyisoprenoid-binding protein YceI
MRTFKKPGFQSILKAGLWGTALAVFITIPAALASEPKETDEEVQGTRYIVNTEKSQVKWVGKKVTGQHDGTISIKNGYLVMDGEDITGGKFIMDMNTIKVRDIKNPDMNQKLQGHLESDDFFSVESHPEATLVIKEANKIADAAVGKPNYEIKGVMTIKNIPQEVNFQALILSRPDEVMATSDLVLDRTRWNVRYGSGKFFENLGDRMIYDDFELAIKLFASRKS